MTNPVTVYLWTDTVQPETDGFRLLHWTGLTGTVRGEACQKRKKKNQLQKAVAETKERKTSPRLQPMRLKHPFLMWRHRYRMRGLGQMTYMDITIGQLVKGCGFFMLFRAVLHKSSVTQRKEEFHFLFIHHIFLLYCKKKSRVLQVETTEYSQ